MKDLHSALSCSPPLTHQGDEGPALGPLLLYDRTVKELLRESVGEPDVEVAHPMQRLQSFELTLRRGEGREED